MANKNSITASSEAVRNDLNKISKEAAIAEYVWNGFDAGATDITLDYRVNEFGMIDFISIRDNGTGILIREIERTFGRYRDSKKRGVHSPIIRGERGLGRFSFFKFAKYAKWESCSLDGNCTIEIDAEDLRNYEVEHQASSSHTSTGCTVSFDGINIFDLSYEYFVGSVLRYLSEEYSFLLKISDKFTLNINSKPLPLIEHSSFNHTFIHESNKFDIEMVLWSKKIREPSYIYFIDERGNIKHKEFSSGNKKNEFYVSVYIRSPWFNDFIPEKGALLPDVHNLECECYKELHKHARALVQDLYRKLRVDAIDEIIASFEAEGLFPRHDELSIPLQRYQKQMLIDTIKVLHQAEPRFFSGALNKQQKKILLKLLDRILLTNDESLFKVLDGVVDLSDFEVARLSKLLSRTKLSNIIMAVEQVQERQDVIEIIKTMHLESRDEVKEVGHIQKVVENNLWLFGEQYHLLTAEEPDFEQALRELLVVHGNEEYYQKGMVQHPDRQKEMDIFAIRRQKEIDHNGEEFFRCLVVELKRANESLKDKHLQQLERYLAVITSNKFFNDGKHKWDFVLVGDIISPTAATLINARISAGKLYCEAGVISRDDFFKISVKTWGQIFSEHSLRHRHLLDSLALVKESISGDPDMLTARAVKGSHLNKVEVTGIL
ncbi:TPA: ATP-binding protein [Aeromonas veronii]